MSNRPKLTVRLVAVALMLSAMLGGLIVGLLFIGGYNQNIREHSLELQEQIDEIRKDVDNMHPHYFRRDSSVGQQSYHLELC
ncbi:hypothetical protein [Vibrio alfacsensis]|uniref:hypothetical protein n=1 Tax=Vibrio alfacsensis TaxID=1074311 RepID=UPI001BEFC334|nr:hypothetical protein [Vibrio alfacsensis]WQE78547.1 hypothetical protein SO574_15480 [Vibrio alfacsensis]BCN26393.1 hypothetical protein VYA_35850 [Vibrio alfacsensis]